MKQLQVSYQLGSMELTLSDADFDRLKSMIVVSPDTLAATIRLNASNYPCHPVQNIQALVHIHASGILMLKDFNLHWQHNDWVVDSQFDHNAFATMPLEDAVDYLAEHSNHTPLDFEVLNLFDLTISDGQGFMVQILFE